MLVPHTHTRFTCAAPSNVSVPHTRGMVVISSRCDDNEALAATGIMVQKLEERVGGSITESLCVLTEYSSVLRASKEDLGNIASVVSTSRALIVILSSGSMECVPQLVALVEAMHHQSKEGDGTSSWDLHKVSTGGWHGPVVIPCNTPDFQFPTDAYYNDVFPRIWPGSAEAASDLVKS